MQKYGYSPSLSNVKLNVSSLRSTSESKLLPSDDDDEEDDVTVCGDESLFIQVTVSPTLISSGFGLYEVLPEFPTMLNTFPSSVIVGDEGDDDVFMWLLKETKEEIPEMELKVLDGSDHWVIIEKPKEMYDILMNFLKKLQRCCLFNGGNLQMKKIDIDGLEAYTRGVMIEREPHAPAF